MLDNTYQHAFTELATAAGELDVALRKVTYATSPELFSALCAQAYSKALAAQSALGELPYGNVELEQTAAFLAKTGDYAMALARDAYGETACTEAHRETLRGLAGAGLHPVRRPPEPAGGAGRGHHPAGGRGDRSGTAVQRHGVG